jgi:hypothetical protein
MSDASDSLKDYLTREMNDAWEKAKAMSSDVSKEYWRGRSDSYRRMLEFITLSTSILK